MLKEEYNENVKIPKNVEDGNYWCNQCSFQTNTDYRLAQHMEETKHGLEKVQDFICDKYGIEFQSDHEFKNHEKGHTSKNTNYCDICDEIFLAPSEVIKHMKSKHGPDVIVQPLNKSDNMDVDDDKEDTSDHIKCNICDKMFKDKREMSKHRKTTHITFKPCKNILNCSFGEDCFYSHKTIQPGAIVCFQCGDTFKSKTQLLNHIKSQHGHTKCLKYLKGQCRFNSNSCFYKHVLSNETDKTEKAQTYPQVFCPPRENLAPPDKLEKLKQDLMNILPNILIQMMPDIMKEVKQNLNLL